MTRGKERLQVVVTTPHEELKAAVNEVGATLGQLVEVMESIRKNLQEAEKKKAAMEARKATPEEVSALKAIIAFHEDCLEDFAELEGKLSQSAEAGVMRLKKMAN